MDVQPCRLRGTVREFDKTRGHGMIEVDNGQQVFVRYSAIIGAGLRFLRSGDRVSFDVEPSHRGLSAVRVVRE